jgi:ribosome-binding factor A
MDNRKLQRINSDILRILSIAINQKIQDDEIYGVSILDVSVSADLSLCRVSVSVDAVEESDQMRVVDALNSACGFLRSEIAHNMSIKNTPALRFSLDKGKANALRVEELLKQIKSGNKL